MGVVSIIVAQYLIMVKGLSYDEASSVIKDWLSKCAVLRHLDFSLDHRIKYAIMDVIQKDPCNRLN
jgi:hypothetical protein